ncbi:hypothetical protein D3C77_699770 [compost metagenome]
MQIEQPAPGSEKAQLIFFTAMFGEQSDIDLTDHLDTTGALLSHQFVDVLLIGPDHLVVTGT